MTLVGEVDTFLSRIEQGEAAAAVEGVLALHDSGLGCSDIIAEVLAPAQLEVGARWATGRWGVADEHAATAVVDDVLGALSARVAPAHGDRTIALCSAVGEWHVTPLRMGALVLREHGWNVRLLGASTPATHLRQTLRHAGADVAAIHCALASNLPGVPDAVEAAHAAGLPVIAAGGGFGSDDRRAMRLGCDGWAPDAQAGARLASTWLESPPPRRQPAPLPHRTELEALRRRRAELVELGHGVLRDRIDTAGWDAEQHQLVRRDLAEVLDAAVATLLVDDERVMEEFLAWRQVVLVARGVPVAALDAALAAVAEVAGAEEPRSLGVLLDHAVARR